MIPARGALPSPRTGDIVVIGSHAAIHAQIVTRLLRQPELVALRHRVRGDDADLYRALVALAVFALQHPSVSPCGNTPTPPTETATSSEWLSTRQVAHLLDVEPRTVRHWIGAGLLPARRFGDGYPWFVHRREVEALRSRRDAA